MTDVLNLSAAYSLIISALLIWKDRNNIRSAFIIMAFLACICSYLLIEYINNTVLRHLVIAGPFLLPFTFWLFTKSLFNNEEIPVRKTIRYLVLTLILYYGFYLLHGLGYAKVTDILSRILSIFFVLLALKESQVGKDTDLDDDRIKLRKYFTYFIGLIVLVTLLVELGLSKTDLHYPQLIQRATILIINSLFIISNFSIKSQLLSKNKRKSEIKNPELIEKIQSAMINEHLYRQEKLTIGQLAGIISEQEYKLRRAINQELGYRNFIDFTNSFRIKEAVDILKDQSKAGLTILEIAYQTGFNSIGPFNRSFKMTTGLTPTEFRKKSLAK